MVKPKEQKINEAEHRRQVSPLTFRGFGKLYLFKPAIKALAEVREVQEKAMGSSGSFCCALDQCLLLPPQPNLSGVREETSLPL